MRTWIALLRGINVGGANKLPMAELRAGLDDAGLANVRTYIQSGNVVFDTTTRSAAKLERIVGDVIEAGRGFRPRVLVLAASDLRAAADGNPYPDAVAEPKSLHYFFLAADARKANVDALDELARRDESWSLSGRVFYLHAPGGIGTSKLAERAERHLGVPATARNHRTVSKLLELAGA